MAQRTLSGMGFSKKGKRTSSEEIAELPKVAKKPKAAARDESSGDTEEDVQLTKKVNIHK